MIGGPKDGTFSAFSDDDQTLFTYHQMMLPNKSDPDTGVTFLIVRYLREREPVGTSQGIQHYRALFVPGPKDVG